MLGLRLLIVVLLLLRLGVRSGGGFLGGLFGGGRGPAGFRGSRAQQGADINATTTLSFRSAVEGATVSLDVEGRTATVTVDTGRHPHNDKAGTAPTQAGL